MIEDQVAPKRCGHTRGKAVVSRNLAIDRIKAAIDARDPAHDILILARTDARACHGLDEAIARAQAFAAAGAEILFVEAPTSETELAAIPPALPGRSVMANIVEGGDTPPLPPAQLEAMGFAIAAYPLTLLSASVNAMRAALADLRRHGAATPHLMPFADLRAVVGFDAYFTAEERYRDPPKIEE